MLWSKGIEITQNLSAYHCGKMLETEIKIYLKIIFIYSSTMCHLPRDIFDIATESFNS